MPGPPDRPGPTRRSLGLLLCQVLLLAPAACGGDEGGAPSATASPTRVVTLPPEPPGIRLSFVQQRFDEGTDKAAITVMNHSGRRLTVQRVGLDWPGYPGPLQPRPYVVASGLHVDLVYRLPEPDCRERHADVEPRAVVATATRVLRRPLDDAGKRFLSRIWKADCGTRLLQRELSLSYAGPWRLTEHDGEPALTGHLSLRRRATAQQRPTVALTEVQGSPIFELALGDAEPLDPDAEQGTVPLVVTSGHRCDPHSRAAVTTPFTFRVWVRLDDDEVTVVAVPGAAAQRRMLAFLDRACREELAGQQAQ